MDVPHCEPISNTTTCFGVTLPYPHTTTQLVSDSENQQDVQKNLVMCRVSIFLYFSVIIDG